MPALPEPPPPEPPLGSPALGESALVLQGLNLHPRHLAGWRGLLRATGCAVLRPGLSGWAAPNDPAWRHVSAARWLADLDAACASGLPHAPHTARPVWADPASLAYPLAAPLSSTLACAPTSSLCAYSMGAVLGLVWALERGVRLRRALLLAPALGVAPRLRLPLSLLSSLLPGVLRVPSLSPPDYRFHGHTSVAAYRALHSLQRRWREQWRVQRDAAERWPERLFIAYHPHDELIDTAWPQRLAEALPGRVTLHLLEHKARPGFPHHLGVDARTLGRGEWRRLRAAACAWWAE